MDLLHKTYSHEELALSYLDLLQSYLSTIQADHIEEREKMTNILSILIRQELNAIFEKKQIK